MQPHFDSITTPLYTAHGYYASFVSGKVRMVWEAGPPSGSGAPPPILFRYPPGGRRLLRVQGDAEDLVRVRVKGTFGLGLGLGLG